ncbi:hypothetical protein BASA81_007103 [Batrachochytrium salamandrivorans]|nr:hypothetical protein BASA81_007103 [Batrachochytrium salamandrivorans]
MTTPNDSERLAEAIKRQNEREKQLSVLLGQGDIKGLKLVNSACSEETFQEAVLENMELFSSTREQAEKDVIKEFKLIGLDMSGFEKT